MMRRSKPVMLISAATLILTLGFATAVRAQDPVIVFDPSNFFEAVAQLVQVVKEVTNMIFQAQRLPINMAARYHASSPAWTTNLLASGFPAAAALIAALNEGDPSGNDYRAVVDPLDLPVDVIGRMPANLQHRLADDYATIQLADSVAAMGVDQSGAARGSGNTLLAVLQSMENDAFSTDSNFHSETALLNKINANSVLGLRVGEETNQFLSNAIEQLIVQNKRARDTEAKLMNATIAQWRYGSGYGADLFQHTAADLDAWSLP